MTAWRKSAVWPLRSVIRASSKTWRKVSHTLGCAFSNSSSSSTEKGCWRIWSASESPCSPSVCPRRRSRLSRVCSSLMSSRNSVLVVPNSHSASALAISVLPVPVGPAKRKTPTGRVGSVTPAFIMATRSTRQSTASSWPRTRCDSRDFNPVQVEVPAVVEDLQGKAGLVGEGDHHIVQSQLRLGTVGPGLQPVQGRLQQAEQVAGSGPVAQVLLRQAPDVIQQLRAFRLRRAVQPLLRQVERRLRGKRLHTQGREGRDRPRLLLQQLFQGCRAGLADDPEGPLLDQGQDDIQGADGAVAVTAREVQGVERGYEPDGPPLAAQLSDDGVQLLLELSDIDLAGDQVGVAADEDDPALVVEPAGEPSQERGLADAALADHETGLRAIGEQRRLEPVDPSLERRMLDDGLRRLGVLVVPDAADRSQQPLVDVKLTPTIEAFEEPVAVPRFEAFQEPAEVSQRVPCPARRSRLRTTALHRPGGGPR